MPVLKSALDPASAAFRANAEVNLGLVARLRERTALAAAGGLIGAGAEGGSETPPYFRTSTG